MCDELFALLVEQGKAKQHAKFLLLSLLPLTLLSNAILIPT
jgi:hypothetical protein